MGVSPGIVWGEIWAAGVWADGVWAGAVAEEEAPTTGGGWLSPEQVREIEQFERRAAKAKEERFRREREAEQERLDELRRIYNRAQGIPEEFAPEQMGAVAEAVAPYRVMGHRRSQIDWAALLADAQAVERLTTALGELQARRIEEEETIEVLLLA